MCIRDRIPTDLIITDEISERVTQKYFFKIIRKGDYFSYDIARKIVKSYQFKKKKETRILNTLELVKDHGGIAKAKAHLNNLELDNFKRSLKDLDNIMVNPVTIPRRWNIPHIPNLLRAYYELSLIHILQIFSIVCMAIYSSRFKRVIIFRLIPACLAN